MATDDRLLQVLRALNEIGPCSVLDLNRATGISRQAIYRVIDSLSRHGYVQRIAGDTRFRLTSEVRALSAGYRDGNWIVEAGTPVLARLQHEVRWPSSLALPDKDKMVVRETNRHRSPFVFDRGGVGLRLPMLQSSLGHRLHGVLRAPHAADHARAAAPVGRALGRHRQESERDRASAPQHRAARL